MQFKADRTEFAYAREWVERGLPPGNAITAAQAPATCAKPLDQYPWSGGVTRLA